MRAAAAALLWSPLAVAAGFAVPEQSARSLGMGGAGAASIEGAAAVYYNPGSLGFEDGLSAELSATLIVPSFEYEPQKAVDGKPSRVEPSLFALPSLFAAAPVAKQVYVGIGAFSNFGLGLRWPEDFDGRFESSAANITTFTVNPCSAYRMSDQLSFGGGVSLVRATVELSQKLNFVDSEGSLRMGGGTYGVGFNAGVSARLLEERLGLGLAYRSATPLVFRGRADFTAPTEFQSKLRDQDVLTHLTLPHQLTLGASFLATARLRLVADAAYTAWSSLDALHIDFQESEELDQDLRRDWRDTVTVRLGAELALEGLSLRAGAGYDPSPSPSDTVSPSLPDGNRLLFSAGAGYRMGNLSGDLGYLLVLVLPRETTGDAFPARYRGTAHLLGLSVAVRQ
ncbi:MAG: outer membrane protein transport protein [Myxococcales bacterium]|nr:outer membrane protein transport protein [Myxococcales bacterium]